MAGFGVWSAIRLKKIKADQVAQWAFGNLTFPFGITNIIVMDADGIFLERTIFHDTLLIFVHAVPRVNQK